MTSKVEHYDLFVAPNGLLARAMYGAGIPDAAPQKIGDIYVDTTINSVYIATNTASVNGWMMIDDVMGKYESELYEDFWNYTSGQLWTGTTQGTGASIAPAVGKNGGILKLTSGSTSGDWARLTTSGGNIIVGNAPYHRITFRAMPGGTATQAFRIGVANNVQLDAAATYGYYFELSSANAQPTHWYACFNNNGAVTRYDTSNVGDTSNYHFFDMIWDATGANVNFYIDGVWTTGPISTFAQNMAICANQVTASAANTSGYVDVIAYTSPRA